MLGFGIWTYYSTTMQSATGSLLYNAELLTKVAFPRIVAPAATMLPGFIDLAVAMVLAIDRRRWRPAGPSPSPACCSGSPSGW